MEVKIVCIGDSITYGYGLEADECWVGILRKKHRMSILNAGINGDTTAGMLSRFEYHVVRSNPEYVFIMGGANDIIQQKPLEQIKSNIQEMIRISKENNIIPFIGLEPNPASKNVPEEWKALTDYDYIINATFSLRDWLLDYCKTNSIKYIDFDTKLKSRLKNRYGLYFLDGVHPDVNGHRMMAIIAKDFFIENGVLTESENQGE